MNDGCRENGAGKGNFYQREVSSPGGIEKRRMCGGYRVDIDDSTVKEIEGYPHQPDLRDFG